MKEGSKALGLLRTAYWLESKWFGLDEFILTRQGLLVAIDLSPAQANAHEELPCTC